MARQRGSGDLVSLQKFGGSNGYEIAAWMAVQERRGVLKRTEVLEEITRLRSTATKASGIRQESSWRPFPVLLRRGCMW